MTAPTPPLTDEQVAEIRARVEAATEGPWFVEPCGDFGSKTATIPGVLRERYGVNGLSCGEDFGTAEFIAHARTDVELLLADRARLTERLAEVEAEREAEVAATIRDYLTAETDVTRPSFHATALTVRLAARADHGASATGGE